MEADVEYKAHVEYKGDAICSVTDPDSKVEITTDGSGKNRYTSPESLFVEAIAASIMTKVTEFAEENDIDIEGVRLDVKTDTDYATGETDKLIVNFHFPIKVCDSDVQRLMHLICSCSLAPFVHRRLVWMLTCSYIEEEEEIKRRHEFLRELDKLKEKNEKLLKNLKKL